MTDKKFADYAWSEIVTIVSGMVDDGTINRNGAKRFLDALATNENECMTTLTRSIWDKYVQEIRENIPPVPGDTQV